MKRMQQVCLGSMKSKCDMVRRRGDVGRMRGDIEEDKRDETTPVGLTRILM
jgi:hypothetical protein